MVGDPLRLRQVLLNLVGNAIKFTETGEVEVEVRMQNAECRSQNEDNSASPSSILHSAFCILHFCIRDTGVGIPAEKQEVIFHAFEQADTSVTREFGGTGLGLAICSRLVALMGGRIEVVSALGRGSAFSFTARFERCPEEDARRSPSGAYRTWTVCRCWSWTTTPPTA